MLCSVYQLRSQVNAKRVSGALQKWQVAVIGLFPLPTLANSGPFPAELGLFFLSLFVVVPLVTFIAITRIFISWRRGLLDGLWVMAIVAAAAFEALWLLAQLFISEPGPISRWPSVYLPLAPVLGIWIASVWNKKRDA